MKLKASVRLLADNVIAPAESYRSENERDLHDRQSDSEHEQQTETPTKTESSDNSEDSCAPTERLNQTAVHDQEAAHTPADSIDDMPQTDGMYAGADEDPLIERIEGNQSHGDTVDGISVTDQGYKTYPDEEQNGLAACDRLTADADPTIFDNAYQPLG
jgi:hypothetical protein